MRLRELYETINLFEAYGDKAAKLQREFDQLRNGFDAKPATQWEPEQPAIPGDPNIPDAPQLGQLVSWAEAAFNRKDAAMLWYLTLIESFYKQNDPRFAGKFEALLGGFEFSDFASLNATLDEWIGPESMLKNADQIKKVAASVNVNNTTVASLIAAFTAADKSVAATKKKATPVKILPGDKIILPLGGQGNWWYLPYNKHVPESEFMSHCGTNHNAANHILSLRDNTPVPWVTVEYDQNRKVLHQMKGRHNAKPISKFHYAMTSLLLSDVVDEIYSGRTYQPSSDFSIFDMTPELVQQVATSKPSLIVNQIQKYPFDFLNAPDFVRANPEFREYAIRNSPGLDVLVQEDGQLNISLDAWENAILKDSGIVIYAPTTLPDYEIRVYRELKDNRDLLGYAPISVRSNYNIMKPLVRASAHVINFVSPRTTGYKEIAEIALNADPKLITNITTDGWPDTEVKKHWEKLLPEGLNQSNFPSRLYSSAELKKLWDNAIKSFAIPTVSTPRGIPDPVVTYETFPDHLYSIEEKQKIWRDAVTVLPRAILKMPDDVFPIEISKELWREAATNRGPAGAWLVSDLPPGLFSVEEKKEIWLATFKKNVSVLESAQIDGNDLSDIFTPEEKKELWRTYMIQRPEFSFQDDDEDVIGIHFFNNLFTEEELADIALKAVEFNPETYEIIPSEYLTLDLLKLVVEDGYELRHIIRAIEHKIDEPTIYKIVEYAIYNNSDAFEDVPIRYQSPDLIEYAIDQDWRNITHKIYWSNMSVGRQYKCFINAIDQSGGDKKILDALIVDGVTHVTMDQDQIFEVALYYLRYDPSQFERVLLNYSNSWNDNTAVVKTCLENEEPAVFEVICPESQGNGKLYELPDATYLDLCGDLINDYPHKLDLVHPAFRIFEFCNYAIEQDQDAYLDVKKSTAISSEEMTQLMALHNQLWD
jgi:hypothetical protein